MEKICLICGEKFNTIPKGESRKYCFNCSPSYIKGDTKGRAAAITAIRHAVKKACIKRKGGKCEICGYDKCIYALEFHHLDPMEKEFNIGAYTGNMNVNLEAVFNEVDKCILVCANCHREIHGREANQVEAPA